MTPTHSNRPTDEQLSELADRLTDPLVMADFATRAHKHPRATREEKAALILMALVSRLNAAPQGGVPRSEARKMGNIFWEQLKALGVLTPPLLLETVLRVIEDFPPRTNEALRDELLREQGDQERRG